MSGVTGWGGPSDDPVFVASRQTLEATSLAHAGGTPPGAPPTSVFPDGNAFTRQETTDGLTLASSTITVHHKLFNMDLPQDVDEYERIQSKAMMARQKIAEFEYGGGLLPEGEYYSVLTEAGNWSKEGDYRVALKYAINKVTHRMGNKSNV